ncbi:MAG: hypothetical protein F6K30_14765, partial [Cyanothece sp. SIO2G6]|nr:hypothetical protein [Cyanothece sp. SIO2G6]
LDSMTPNARYRRLNDAIMEARGGELSFLIKGIDELDETHDNVMLESCILSIPQKESDHPELDAHRLGSVEIASLLGTGNPETENSQ